MPSLAFISGFSRVEQVPKRDISAGVGQKPEIQDEFSSYSIEAGQYVRLPEGAYTFTSPAPVEFIYVMELPEQVWEHEKNLYDTIFRPRLQRIDHRLVQNR